MGNCAPTQARPQQSLKLPPMMMKQDPVWEKIRDYSFDRGHFYFVEEIQDIYTEIFGAYLIPDRVAMLVLDFKRFIYLLYKYYTRHQPIQKTEEDSQLSYFPQPQMIASPILDRIWRLLLSNTSLYKDFCNQTLGGFLDRNLYINPKLLTYQTAQKCYLKQFGDPNPLVWPDYVNQQNLIDAYHGFFYIKASEFIEFHHQFERAYVFDDKADQSKVLEKEISDLKYQYKRELKIEGKEVVIWSEPMVKASNEPIEAPVKHEKVKVIQHQLDDDDVDMEEPESSEEDQEESEKQEEPKQGQEPAKQEQQNQELDDNKNEQDQMNGQADQQQSSEQKPSEPQKEATEEQDSKSQTKQVKPEQRGKESELTFGFQDHKALNRYLTEKWHDKYKEIKEGLQQYKIEKQVTHFFESDMNTSPELTTLIFEEYKRYLLLYSLGAFEHTFIPPHYVKVAWDNHIAQTVLYRKFCYKIFNRFIHSSPIPRKADDTQREAYVSTLKVYRIIFKKYPPTQVWPDASDRFDYQTLYSYKYFNIYGYIVEVLNKIKSKQPQPVHKQNEEERRERRLSIQSMSVSTNPSRGREYISYKQGTSID